MKLAIFANGILLKNIGGGQKHMREVIQLLPEFHDIILFPEPQEYGNKDMIDFAFMNRLINGNIKISPYFIKNYMNRPDMKEIIANYMMEIKGCNLIYDLDFQYYLDNFRFGGEISQIISKKSNIKMGACLQDLGDISSFLVPTIKSSLNLSRLAAGMSAFIMFAGFFNFINRKLTIKKLISNKNLLFITMINNDYKKNLKLDFKKIFLLNPSNALDEKIKKYRTNKKKNQIIFYGRLIYQKGLFDAIYAYKKILEHHQVVLKISGKFQRGFEMQEFKKLIKKLNIEDGVQYMGTLDDDALYNEISESRLMIYPSHSDSFSISVLQSLYLHVPVVAYDIPGLSLYKNLKSVALVGEFDTDAMANMALKLMDSCEDLFDDIKLEKLINNHLDWKYVAKAHANIIDEAIRHS